MRIAILVTHLLGTGHLNRASLIADGFAAARHEALVLSGGMPAPNAMPQRAEFLQLPPLRADSGAFAYLVDEAGETVGDTLLNARRNTIETTLRDLEPHMLITELFPFGRRKLAGEFEAAIASVEDALIYGSIRDILQRPRKAGRVDEAEDRFARLYDGAFCHGDDALMPLSESWPLPEALSQKVAMTGYVGTPVGTATGGNDGAGEIVVAAGGGAVGDRLFTAAAEASVTGKWRLLVGGHDREARIAALRARFPDGTETIIEPVRPDFRALLSRCDLAILQCGYNTAMDVVATGARALFCPFEGEGETEQLMRAGAMAAQFGCGVIREGDLSAQALSRTVAETLAKPKPYYDSVKLDGVAATITLAERAIRTRFGAAV